MHPPLFPLTIGSNIQVKAAQDVAITSPDYLMPWGTRRDNSRNKRFNEKLYRLFADRGGVLKVLDLGCSGGGFVKDCLDDGCLSVGLEGSDFSKKHRRAEWATIPEYLFTCDVTADFVITAEFGDGRRTLQFDVVTSWELIEHIAEQDLAQLATNVRRHLSPSGIWVMSISPNEEVIAGIRLHQTVKPKEWWINKWSQLGFAHLERYVDYFNTQFVRGPKYDAPGSFHLVLSPEPTMAPHIPPSRTSERIYDQWLGSKYQILLRKWLIGL